MDDIEETDDVGKLVFAAETLSDKLAVVSHSHTLRYFSIVYGLAATLIIAAAFALFTFGNYEPRFRFASVLFQLSPLLLIFSGYIFVVLILAFYRLSLDKMYLQLVRKRLYAAISEAHDFSKYDASTYSTRASA